MVSIFKKITYQHFVTPLIIFIGILQFTTGYKTENSTSSSGYQQVNFVSDTTRLSSIRIAE